MRKFVVIFSLLLAGIILAKAQSDRVHYRVETGIGVSHIYASGGNSMLGIGISSRLGGAVEFVLSQKSKREFYLTPGLEYRHTNWISVVIDDFFLAGFLPFPIFDVRHAKTDRLLMPLCAGYRFKFGRLHALSLEGGLLGSYGFLASDGIYASRLLNRFDLGVKGSITYTLWRFSFGVQANYGLTDSTGLPSFSAHSLDAFYTLGFRF